jgi:hypothetical protein
MGGDDSQKLLPWRGSYSSPGRSKPGYGEINTLAQTSPLLNRAAQFPKNPFHYWGASPLPSAAGILLAWSVFVPTVVDLPAATQVAERYLSQHSSHCGLELKLFSEKTMERGFGWVFFYGPEDESIVVAGNAPFIVDRNDGSIHVTGTAHPTEAYLDSYASVRRTYPFAVPEHLVLLEGWKPGMLKVSLTKTIRSATGKGLAEAKNCTDALLAGATVALTFPIAVEADKFCEDVRELGVVARRETRYH